MLRRLFGFVLVLIGQSLSLCPGRAAECTVSLAIDQPAQPIELPEGRWLDGQLFHIRLTNMGDAPVQLVAPGDGSESGLRTPIIAWSVSNAAGPVSQKLQRDDNMINHLEPKEVFDLAPGAGYALDGSVLPLVLPGPGKYRVNFLYRNEPHRVWTGRVMGRHDAAAMQRVQDSTPCELTSNTVEVEIVAPRLEHR